MTKKRDLLRELNINEMTDIGSGPLDINIEQIKDMVHSNINSAYSERKLSVMKSKRKISAVAAAAVLVLGITVFAASGIIRSWHSSSSSVPEYTSLPTAKQCIDDIGYTPVLIESFKNGYSFADGSVVSNDLRDDGGNSVEKFKSVTFRYEKDGDEVNLSQEKFNSEVGNSGDVIASVSGVDIYYDTYMNKLVPPDYKMTDEDKKAEESGELVFSWGVDKACIKKVQSVSFAKDGIHYNLLQIDGNLSSDELAEMAKEIIEK